MIIGQLWEQMNRPLQTTNILVLIVFFMICICVSETNHNKKYCTTLIIMIKCTFVKKVLLLDCWQGRIQNMIIALYLIAKNIFFLKKREIFFLQNDNVLSTFRDKNAQLFPLFYFQLCKLWVLQYNKLYTTLFLTFFLPPLYF